MSPFYRLLLLTCIFLVSSTELQAQFEGKVLPSFADDTQDFGTVKASIRPDGIRMIVGAPTDASIFFPRTEYGAAYVFHFEDGAWQERARLALDEQTIFFAAAVDISGDWAFVGHHYNHSTFTSGGSVHAYRYIGDEWVYYSLIVPSDLDENFLYGVNLDLDKSGKQAVIGSLGGRNDFTGLNSGAAYVLEEVNGTWQESAKLHTALDGEFWFGKNVAMDGQRILAAANSVVDSTSNWPAVYFFEKEADAWVQKKRFYPEEQFSNYGVALSVNGSWAAVGDNLALGKVYMYQNFGGEWFEHSILKTPTDTTRTQNGFGSSVSVDSTRLVVGAPRSGLVYEYFYDETEDEWIYKQEWTENGLLGPEVYGSHVYSEEGVLFVGAPGQVNDQGGEGIVYVYGDAPPVISSNTDEFPELGLTISVYPNPVTDKTKLAIQAERGGDLKISAYDMLGRSMGLDHKHFLKPGENFEQIIESTQWPAGAYLITAEYQDRMINQMIIKN